MPSLRRARRRPTPTPLTPWRFPASALGGAAVVARLLAGASTVAASDGALARGAAFGGVVWISTGVVDRILGAAQDRRVASVRPTTGGQAGPGRRPGD